MDEELAEVPGGGRRKAIRPARDRWQSDWLAWGMGILVSASFGLDIFKVVGMEPPQRWFFWSLAVSAAFAALVWKMRASTRPGAVIGGTICLSILIRQDGGFPWFQTAFPELVAVLAMTLLATRFGRRRKEAMGVAMPTERHGRRASQVLANLGFASVVSGMAGPGPFIAVLAALAEAAADTVSSELGQVLGGQPRLITTGRFVRPGEDGGITLIGTACGVAAAGVVAVLAMALGAVDGIAAIVVFLGGCAGLLFDSFLGATFERLGWIGNDWVNLLSTVFAAVLAYAASLYLVPPLIFW